ncbi:SIR2 family NAD-dependent protein deacylase [Salinisphaera orenii]|uniref:SIR2 family NAD-dependent protein deacylase n=1 Tax=Salinisphaera orenii TaxID=856731 RepID=UPI00160A0756|nr:SIR2 family protein [Salinisphaera orenii]
MAQELYGAHASNAPNDPLRVAEEFRAGLGDAALTDFLRRRIRDEAFEPGTIHHELLALPWTDVLTTNYDTLLERASKDSRRGYDHVLKESDLAHARGPRIVKLHGSLQDGADVVISEEDYRAYPQRQAAFVNTARQVFIENELCLLGFSGDDPNFLQWAGWVRDRLAGRARRIYLVGALDLPPIKRRLLEARGIAPIDMASAVTHERTDRRHAVAISLFLEHLKAARPQEPNDWTAASQLNYPTINKNDHENWSRDFKDHEKVVEALREALEIWRQDRRAYPGWVICPREKRLWIRQGTSNVDNLQLALDTLSEKDRRDALLELAWRYDQGGQPLPQYLIYRLDGIATAESLAETEPALVRSLARVLLSSKRAADDEKAFMDSATRLEAVAAPNDLPALVAHERCLFARDQLNFTFVAENASKIDGDDPVWALRRAALLYWIGRSDEAARAVGTAGRALRSRVLRDPDSVALRSRLAWATMLARALVWQDDDVLLAELDGVDRLQLRNYDPWDELRSLDTKISNELRKNLEAKQIEPGFEAGTYRDNRHKITIGNSTDITPLSELRYLAERAGLPIRSPYVNLLGTRLADALRLEFEPTAAWYSAFLSTKPGYSKEPIDIHLGRIPVARLSLDVVTSLRARIKKAIAFWRDRVRRRADLGNDVNTLRLYIEALSRLTARDDAASAKEHARLAVDLARDDSMNHWWLNEPIGHLLKRSFDAVPYDKRGELSPELLRFPVAAEREILGTPRDWYDPAADSYRFVLRSVNEAAFDSRVADFLEQLTSETASRPEAAIRLLYLHEKGQLTNYQTKSFANALWKNVSPDDNALPMALELFPHAFLITPEPPEINARARVYSHLFAQGEAPEPMALVAAASGRTPYLQPSEADAARLFSNVIAWRPKEPDPDPVSNAFIGPEREREERAMASVLGIVAAPALAKCDRTIDRAEATLTFLEETKLSESLAALPMFYGLSQSIDRRIEFVFYGSLSVHDRRISHAAVGALDRWLRLAEQDIVSPLPDALRDHALRALERGRISVLTHLIYFSRRLIEADYCGGAQLDQITEVLEELRAATEYGPPDGDTEIEPDRAVSIPLIRAECVRLATVIERKEEGRQPTQAWLDIAAFDPLPEVRNAAHELTND